jgi:hypothetical protein
MSVEAWRAIASRFGQKYGVEVMVGGQRAYCEETRIVLPGDVPEKMQDVMHGLFLHCKEHILQKDHEALKPESPALQMGLSITQDIHNDELILQTDPGYEALNQMVHEYQEKKVPMDQRRQLFHWKQKVAVELHNRSLPRSVWEGESLTDDRRVKNFFKKNKRAIKKMMRELKDLRPNKAAQKKWAEWLMVRLFDELLTEDEQQELEKNPGQGIPDRLAKAILDQIKGMPGSGLTPPGLNGDNFECVSPGDLKQKVPEKVTVQKLKEFLTQTFEKVTRDESGSIDPSKLPTYWQGDDDLFQDETKKVVKHVKIKVAIDSSGSMDSPLEDNEKRYSAVIRGLGLVAQAVERITNDEGMDISLEVWAFASTDRLLKRPEERWDPGLFKQKYMANFGGGTAASKLIKNFASENNEEGTLTIVVVLTDGGFGDNADEEIEKGMADPRKKWLLIGVGTEEELGDQTHFRFLAKTLADVEYILCQVVQEAAANL